MVYPFMSFTSSEIVTPYFTVMQFTRFSSVGTRFSSVGSALLYKLKPAVSVSRETGGADNKGDVVFRLHIILRLSGAVRPAQRLKSGCWKRADGQPVKVLTHWMWCWSDLLQGSQLKI